MTYDNLVDPNEMLLPLLHITLGSMKQGVNAPNKVGDCIKCISRNFPTLMYNKVTEIFVEPLVRELTIDE
jgi:hypothetical protein